MAILVCVSADSNIWCFILLVFMFITVIVTTVIFLTANVDLDTLIIFLRFSVSGKWPQESANRL